MNRAIRATAAAAVLATAGGLLTAAVTTPAAAATGSNTLTYKRQFFTNTTFSGTPKRVDSDSVINQDWTGAPFAGMPRDHFSVRWTVTHDFGSGGPFTLAASGLDGIRVYLDGVRKIDLWRNTSTTVRKNVNVTIPKGRHTLRIDYVNWTGAAAVKFSAAPRTSPTVDKVAPLAPTNFGAGYTREQDEYYADISWSPNKEMDLAGYRLYARPAGSSTWTKVATTTPDHLGVDPHGLIPSDKQYYLELRAFDKAGNESVGTADRPFVLHATPPATPSGLSAEYRHEGDAFYSQISWTPSQEPNLIGYNVYRQLDGTTAWTYAGYASAGSSGFRDTLPATGQTFHYKVRCFDKWGNVSEFSDVVTVTATDNTPVPPTGA